MEKFQVLFGVLLMCFQTLLNSQRCLTNMLIVHRQRMLIRRRRQIQRLQIKMLQRLCRRRAPVIWAHPRSRYWWDSIVPDFTAQQFLQNFRLSRESFKYICDRTKDHLRKEDTQFRVCIPVQKRVAIAIWKLATGGEYRVISQLFGVGLSTVFNCVQDFCNAVIKVLLPVHIATPDATKLLELATFFKNRWRIPQCVGAIDACHIPIIAPKSYPKDYLNRKGWHSFVLQAVVDGKGMFWDICVGFPGCLHKAKVLRGSALWETVSTERLLEQNKVKICGSEVGYYLIGDSAYPMQTWLMRPFLDTSSLTPQQQNYNSCVGRAQSVVERAFRRLKGRWRSLLKRNDCKLELAKKIALTCCVLHNICEEDGDAFELAESQDHGQPRFTESPDHADAEGTDIRSALMEYFSSDVL